MPQIVRDIFENYVKETFDLEDCIAVNNGTSALIASLWSMDLKPEDEVITTAFTFIATSNAILIAGGKPVFVDIDPDTLLIDASQIEKAITPNTKAILPVHLYGRICDMKQINQIAKKHNLVVIEDTSQAFGAIDHGNKGKYAGMMGDCGTFSFYKTKNISTFEGGMICIPKNSKLNAKKIRSICNQGQEGRYNHVHIGFNFRLAEPLCLMAYEQMKLHMTGVKAELGLRGPNQGHYPQVVYNQPVYINKGIKGYCPEAEKAAFSIRNKLPVEHVTVDLRKALYNSSIKKPLSKITLVQIGANDGKQDDPIHRFIKETGCTAHLCEPIPEYFDMLKNNYQGCDNVYTHNIAISTEDGTSNMTYIPDNDENPEWLRGLGTLDTKRNFLGGKTGYGLRKDNTNDPLYKKIIQTQKQVDVKTNTLETFLNNNNISNVDIFVTDTEGWDNIIFQQLDLEKYSPYVILMETHTLPSEELEELNDKLRKYNYSFEQQWDTLATR